MFLPVNTSRTRSLLQIIPTVRDTKKKLTYVIGAFNNITDTIPMSFQDIRNGFLYIIWRVVLLSGPGCGKIFLYSLLSVLVSSFFVDGESISYSGGGFSIAPPPLGYTGYYGTESPKRHRVDAAYQYYDLEVSEVQGGSVYANSRIIGGSWGSFSLQYGGFYLFGTDKGADNGADVDMTVSGFNVVPSAETGSLPFFKRSAKGVYAHLFFWDRRGISVFYPGFQ